MGDSILRRDRAALAAHLRRDDPEPFGGLLPRPLPDGLPVVLGALAGLPLPPFEPLLPVPLLLLPFFLAMMASSCCGRPAGGPGHPG